MAPAYHHPGPRGLVIAAPASGQGKTVVTLAILRALRRRGVRTAPFKVGPDYIDPAYLTAAAGRPALNLDPWAMRRETLAAALAGAGDADLVLVEGVMGLFDGAADGTGSTADLAAAFGLPVLLVVDARGMGASIAALVDGFCRHRREVEVAGVILNRVGGPRHERMVRQALALPVLGCVPRSTALDLPSRHLGLVQAGEHTALEAFLDAAAELVGSCVDLDRLQGLARPVPVDGGPSAGLPPLGQRIAVALDRAFAFLYPGLIDGWRAAGAEIGFFSPLLDEPPAFADAVFLPGGYPELHAPTLANSSRFLPGLRAAAARGAVIYGECGGYMVLGSSLTDASGAVWPMAGLLPVSTSFAEPRRHLGYRAIRLAATTALGTAGSGFRGHEFHYASELERRGPPLFEAATADGEPLGPQGCIVGRVLGSFLHLVDRVRA